LAATVVCASRRAPLWAARSDTRSALGVRRDPRGDDPLVAMSSRLGGGRLLWAYAPRDVEVASIIGGCCTAVRRARIPPAQCRKQERHRRAGGPVRSRNSPEPGHSTGQPSRSPERVYLCIGSAHDRPAPACSVPVSKHKSSVNQRLASTNERQPHHHPIRRGTLPLRSRTGTLALDRKGERDALLLLARSSSERAGPAEVAAPASASSRNREGGVSCARRASFTEPVSFRREDPGGPTRGEPAREQRSNVMSLLNRLPSELWGGGGHARSCCLGLHAKPSQ